MGRLILALETSGIHGGVAISEGERVLIELELDKGMVHGRQLPGVIQDACKECGIQLSQIDIIAVDIGPGSYTGLRVGLACAKTLAYALNRPLIDISSLDILAENVPIELATYVCPLIDARWGQLYAAVYRFAKGQRERLTDYLSEGPERVVKILPVDTKVFGDGLDRYGQIFASFQRLDPIYNIPRAGMCARLASRRSSTGYSADLWSCVPMYLRPTEAELRSKGAV
jgi:tRNA threonylcarbamoyladenosine biosynthesis protein TsaB